MHMRAVRIWPYLSNLSLWTSQKNWQELLFDIRRSENVTAVLWMYKRYLGKFFKKILKTRALVRWQVFLNVTLQSWIRNHRSYCEKTHQRIMRIISNNSLECTYTRGLIELIVISSSTPLFLLTTSSWWKSIEVYLNKKNYVLMQLHATILFRSKRELSEPRSEQHNPGSSCKIRTYQ